MKGEEFSEMTIKMNSFLQNPDLDSKIWNIDYGFLLERMEEEVEKRIL